jgi:hypothetical protein
MTELVKLMSLVSVTRERCGYRFTDLLSMFLSFESYVMATLVNAGVGLYPLVDSDE